MAGMMQETGSGVPYVDILDLTADLVRAHVSKSDVPPEMLRTLILEVHGTLKALSEPQPAGAAGPIPMSPAAVLASPEERASVVAAAYAKRDEAPAAAGAAEPTTAKTNEPTRTADPTETAEPALPASLVPQTLEGAARRKRAVAVPPPLPSPPDDAPAVPPALSLRPDAVIDLAGGKPHGNLGRFIADARGEDPEAYRRRFGLPKEYPMMAPRLIRTRGRVSEVDPVTLRRLSGGPVERDARFDGDPKAS